MLFQEYLKSVIDDRERSVQELLRVRQLLDNRPRDIRWHAGSRSVPRRINRGERGL
jgi:hypothetical protein